MSKGKILTGAQIVVQTLIEQGVTDVFGYPGGQILSIYDELYKASDSLRHILTAHEQGASHAADGYARVTGKVGVVIATSGPGATNLVTGIATAMLDSVPMVAITGNVPSDQVGKDGFQEVNITGVTMPITKHNYFISNVEELADAIREAFRIAKSGRPGPVLIDIPKDVQQATCEYIPKEVEPPFSQKKAKEQLVEEAVAMIHSAKRPYLYIGGGAAGNNMTELIQELAEKIDGYIGCSFMGLSVLPNSYERFLGMQGMHGKYASSMASKEADLMIGLGVRFSDRATGNSKEYGKKTKIIQLDADLSEINKNVIVDVGIVGDMVSAFREIVTRCKPQTHPQWKKLVNELKKEEQRMEDEAEASTPHLVTPKQIMNAINRQKEESTIIVTDVGQHQMWTAQYVNFERTRRFVSSGGLGTMGYGLGAAIGAEIATGDKTVLITGDGSFGMNLNELATAVSYHLPIVIVLMNNGVLGMVRQWQTLFYEQRYSNTELNRKTDFVKVAEGFGAKAKRVWTVDEFETIFQEAIKGDEPYLIEVMIDKDELVLPMLPPGGSVDEIIVSKEQENKG